MQNYHDDPINGGHIGITRMIRKKKKLGYHWKGMTKDITKYAKKCKAFQMNKPSTKAENPLF